MPPRVVLDTNSVISALLFVRGRLAWLRGAWQSKRFVPLVSHNTASELIRVLSYPKFALDHAERESLLADFLPYAEVVKDSRLTTEYPELRDPQDVKFLVLAETTNADALVSGDRDIQEIRGRLQTVSILLPSEFPAWLDRYDYSGPHNSDHRHR